MTPVAPRPIPPERRGDQPLAVARCLARHAAQRCRGPENSCPSRPPGHARCLRRGCRRRRPGRGSAPRCARRAPRCRRPAVRTRRCECLCGSRCPVSRPARNASAQRIAWVGPSKVARWPSPVLFTTVPPNRSVSSAGDFTKAVEHRAPSLVARGRGVLCRRDDIGEQHGAQRPM